MRSSGNLFMPTAQELLNFIDRAVLLTDRPNVKHGMGKSNTKLYDFTPNFSTTSAGMSLARPG